MKFFRSAIGRVPSAAGLVGSTAALALLVATFVLPAFADNDGAGVFASDPTVGTLPMSASSGLGFIDQTLTLRGDVQVIRGAIIDAGGRGEWDTIPLGAGPSGNAEAWMRFFGDVRIELDLTKLADVDVALFAGFDGGGLRFAVRTHHGVGAVQLLEVGDEANLEPLRLLQSGLLQSGPVSIHALHRDGTRTCTTLEYRPEQGTLVIYQDV